MTPNEPFQASPEPPDFLGKTPVFGPKKAENTLKTGHSRPLAPRKGNEMNADELILAMAREKARTFGISLRDATYAVLADPANSRLAEQYVSGADAEPTITPREHLRLAMATPVAKAARGMPIDEALAQCAKMLVAQGRCLTLSEAVRHLLLEPDVAAAYQDGRDVVGVAGAEIRLSPLSPVPAGPRIACFPIHAQAAA